MACKESLIRIYRRQVGVREHGTDIEGSVNSRA